MKLKRVRHLWGVDLKYALEMALQTPVADLAGICDWLAGSQQRALAGQNSSRLKLKIRIEG